jgi:cyclic-di-GMP phosphodiesterase, flagellum assembly factor TipF
MINVLVVVAYALASATLGLELNRLYFWDTIPSALTAALAFALFAQLHAAALKALERRRVNRQFDQLEAANGAIKSELDETRQKMAEVTAAIAKRGDAQEKKVIGELQIIEGLIREFTATIAKNAKDVPHEEPAIAERPENVVAVHAPVIDDPQLLEVIRRSLEENRVDLYLQPTVSLPQRKVRFYEALSRLRSEDGTVIMPAQYIKVAAPAGLMSLVDNLLLFRCVQIVRQLTQKRRDLGVFCNISGHTLTDSEFFPQFLDYLYHNRDLAGRIVFEFTQDTVIGSGAREEASLSYLSGLGFQLSMDQVTTLGLDFARLKALGFHFIKVKAETLISGMPDANAAVAAEDFKDLLARNGISLIVERIEDEKTVAQLLDHNVDYGQGYLFGEPKPIREMAEAHDAHTPLASVANVTFLSNHLARRLAG